MEMIQEFWYIYLVGAGMIAFCLYKFFSGKKKLKEKRDQEATEDSNENT